jgi:putative membrane protein
MAGNLMDALHRLFREADLEAVRAAVAEAERKTSGEIVSYFVEESDAYTGTLWKGTALGAFTGPLIAEAIYFLGNFWGGLMPLWIALPAAAGGALGFLLTAYVPTVKRWVAGAEVLDLRTRQRAEIAFLEQEVFRTRDRTGILIFLSLFEHRVVVLSDSGINQKAVPGQWDGIVQTVVAGIRAGKPGEALVEAIRQCGALLETCGVAVQPDDRNELENELRRGDC